jgi:hypothetical protein
MTSLAEFTNSFFSKGVKCACVNHSTILYSFIAKMQSFKKRWKIMNDEMLQNKWQKIYIERKINNLIKKRYPEWEIKTNSSYIYRKMAVLLEQKIYLEARWIPKQYVSAYGYVNIFELHKYLDDIIRKVHIPNRHLKRYQPSERKYLKQIEKNS